MKTPIGQVLAVTVAVTAAVSGCGGSGNGTGSGGPRMTWKDDGVTVNAVGTTSRLSTSAGRDDLAISGTDFNAEISLSIAVPTPLTPQTFICGQTATNQTLSASYSASVDAGLLLSTQSCTLVIRQVGALGGAPAVGTFEVVFNVPAGGTKNITNGSFNLPLMM